MNEVKKLIDTITSEPMLVALSGYNVVKFEITLPSGALLKLLPGKPYTTSDKADLDFLSKMKGISITRIGDPEYRRYFTKLISELPTVFNKEMTETEAQEFFWNTAEEKAIVEELRKRGYEINPPTVETESGYISTKNGDDKEIVKIPPIKSTPKKRVYKKK